MVIISDGLSESDNKNHVTTEVPCQNRLVWETTIFLQSDITSLYTIALIGSWNSFKLKLIILYVSKE